MKAFRVAAITVSLSWIWFSCQSYELSLDNPIDEIAHADSGYYSPALTMFPLIQTVEVGNSITIGSYIVDHDTAITSLAGVHMRVTYDGGLLKLDTILPGVLFTNNGANTPLFTHNTSGGDMIDILSGIWVMKALYLMLQRRGISLKSILRPGALAKQRWNTIVHSANWSHLWMKVFLSVDTEPLG